MIENIISNFGSIDFPQIIGFIALIGTITSYQTMSQRGMFGMRIAADSIWTAHYIFLDIYNAAFTIFAGILRTAFIVFWKPHLKNYAIVVSIVFVFLACHFYPQDGFIKYMPFIASFIFSVSQYFHDDFLKCRIIMMFAPIAWLIFGFVVGSYSVVGFSLYTIISNSVGIVRFIIKKKVIS